DENVIRTVNTRVTQAKGRYCTLSHSWGGAKLLKTALDNVEKFLLKGIETSELENSKLKEAIQISRSLDVRYIWIDSLCTIQDPPRDFKTEDALMRNGFRNSYCNIVAAGSDASKRGGLLRGRELDALLDSFIYSQGWVFQGKYFVALPTPAFGISGSKIYLTFTERMISPRILYFARIQIFWDCGTISACESLPSGFPLLLDHLAATDWHWRGHLAYN
ncbi:uncharacterized protein BDR25DRAFT_239391, partial [Lindgomyces ingoldianus]